MLKFDLCLYNIQLHFDRTMLEVRTSGILDEGNSEVRFLGGSNFDQGKFVLFEVRYFWIDPPLAITHRCFLLVLTSANLYAMQLSKSIVK